MANLNRRTLLTGAIAGAGAIAVPHSAIASPTSAPGQIIRGRGTLPSGIQSGEVTPRSAVVWSRSSVPGRLVVTLPAGRSHQTREIRGPWATEATDFTAKVDLRGLQAGREYEYTVEFEDERGRRGERAVGHFSTPSLKAEATSFVWTGDTAGQGWGINPDLGGMVAYRAMAATRPDFFIHSGDNIYADGPMSATVTERDGQIWRNIVTPEVAKVAETLTEFRGRYRYNQMDANIRAMYAQIPVLSQWDDHEVTNNWYPSEILDDARYTEKRVDVLAARGRQAYLENMPITSPQVYRHIPRGRMLDVFLLDMRTFRDINTPGLETERVDFLGGEQVEWLLRGLEKSKATWKVIAADMPIGLIVPDGANIEAIAQGDNGAPKGREIEMAYLLSEIKRRKIRNVVWVTADVHYCAEHYYDPNKAAFSDFDPFYEFVAGPISAGGFGPNKLEGTFGPQLGYVQTPDYVNQSPRNQKKMFFGHVDIAADGHLTVTLRNGLGEIQHTRHLEPQR
ncbi:alkaline phosphatase D family protein [Kribbia dieselivorans]|uniref:alkaline phosphatase D family protein n=1 Tax=Kribbia dieselivorans TaxID=331526 RepID=UPI000A8E3464|nr:alkaline phosphatase D family protein [Kribbia dieselivorans]